MKRVIKKEKIFRFCSVIFLSSLFVFFSFRLVYNYMKEQKANSLIDNGMLSTKIINNLKKENYLYNDNKYILKNLVENNYVSYSGILWRIVSVDDGKIKLVSDENVTVLPFGKNYDESNVIKWLNSTFKSNLTQPDLFITEFDSCVNNVDKIEKSDCNNSKNYVSLLSMNDYIDAGANNSYLNNNTYFWLSALNESEPWYVFDNGGLKTDSNNHIYGVRPVIVLNDIEYIYGNGTKSSPYIISNEPVDTLSEIELGSYIDYSGYTWKVVSKDETSVKVVLSTPLKLNDEEIKKIYSKKYNYYNLNDSTGIAYYLNHTFYNTLKDKKYLKKGDFYIGKFDTYDLEELYNEKVNAYVGLLTVGDIFVTQNIDMYLLSSVNDDNTIPVLNKNNSLFYNFISYESGIKPVIYLDNKVEVKGGMGDENYPFELR